MYTFGAKSTERLATCSQGLQKVARRALEITPHDFCIVCGYRDEAAQDAAFFAGTSKARWPNSRHNEMPSQAVDVAPWLIDASTDRGHIPWDDRGAFYMLAGIILVAARMENTRIRYGGDWNSDGSTQQAFHDLGHFEEV